MSSTPNRLNDLQTRLRAVYATLADIRRDFPKSAAAPWSVTRAEAFADAADHQLWTAICTLAAAEAAPTPEQVTAQPATSGAPS